MSVYRNALLILLGVALLLAPVVSAQQVEKSQAIIVLPGDGSKSPIYSPLVYDTIIQGETDYFTKYVSSGTSQLTLDLNWGTPSNSLSLWVNTPVGLYGPYYDSSDGIPSNGRIALVMSGSGSSLPAGTWEFRVYGNSVSGVEDYTFVAY
jgi:hypothetical protein